MTDEIQAYTAARIAKLTDVKELVKIKNMADAATVFYTAQDDDATSQQMKEISMRSARQAGVVLLPPDQGGLTPRELGGRPENNSLASLTSYQQVVEDAGISGNTANKWQKVARVPDDKFEIYFTEAEYKNWEYTLASLLRFAGDWYDRSDTGVWETPQWLFDLLDDEFHFRLDVCALPENAKCKKYYTPDDNALEQEWTGSCWMNPPYGDVVGHWLAKAKVSAASGATVVCLVPARTDTSWWWDNCIGGEIRFIKGRLEFVGSTSAAPFPSAVVVLSPGHKRKVVWWDVRPQ